METELPTRLILTYISWEINRYITHTGQNNFKVFAIEMVSQSWYTKVRNSLQEFRVWETPLLVLFIGVICHPPFCNFRMEKIFPHKLEIKESATFWFYTFLEYFQRGFQCRNKYIIIPGVFKKHRSNLQGLTFIVTAKLFSCTSNDNHQEKILKYFYSLHTKIRRGAKVTKWHISIYLCIIHSINGQKILVEI